MGEAFDPYLGPYVQLEREGLEKLMESVMRAEVESLRGGPIEGETPPAPGQLKFRRQFLDFIFYQILPPQLSLPPPLHYYHHNYHYPHPTTTTTTITTATTTTTTTTTLTTHFHVLCHVFL